MLQEIKEAFEVYTNGVPEKLEKVLKEKRKPCEKCQKNIDMIKGHKNFNHSDLEKSHVLNLDFDDEFALDTEHMTRLSEHSGMPLFEVEHYCEKCSTSFVYSIEGFHDEKTVEFRTGESQSIEDYLSLIEKEKKLYTHRFAPFLNKRFFEDEDKEVELYLSLDENLRRSNHDYLVSYYNGEGLPLEEIDIVHASLSEDSLFTSSRCGGIYEREFLQKVKYPLNKISFDFGLYFDSIEVNVNINDIKERVFFDVYSKEFVDFKDIDFENIHMFKRNDDTYEFFEQKRTELNLKPSESIDHFKNMFDEFFEGFKKEFMLNEFGDTYQEYLDKKEFRERWDQEFIESMKVPEEKPAEKVAAEIDGIKEGDNIVVQGGIYKDLKGYVKKIDTNRKRIGVVFFGDKISDNIVYIDSVDCLKV